jgi:CRISPR/Cas system CSM-associated protein Csm3 (group 7 of RAMP superfamily)
MECELEALSPLLVMDSTERADSKQGTVGKFMQSDENGYVIPGTSLKGMIRSVFEVLVPSCVGLHDHTTTQLIPDRLNLKPCSRRTNLCPTCRTFGFTGGGRSHRGNVNIGDARAVERPSQGRQVQIVGQFNPNPDESDRYRNADRSPKGRKFYYHQHELNEATTQNEKKYGKHLVPLAPGATFRFTVGFQNLPSEALSTLVAALALADEAPLPGGGTTAVRHKLGYGKAAGLGSVDVRVRSVQLDPDPETRYREFGASREEPSDLDAWVQERQDRFFENPSPPVQDLIEVLRYPPPENRTYGYLNDW